MASFRSATTANNGAGSTSITINKPSGVVAGDLLVAAVGSRDNPSYTTVPSGWTALTSSPYTDSSNNATDQCGVWWKIAGGSEPSSYQWASSGSTRKVGAMLAYQDVDIEAVINAQGRFGTTGAQLNQTTATINPTVDNCIIVSFFLIQGTGSGQTWSAITSGLTSRANFTAGSSNLTLGVFEATQTTATSVSHTARHSTAGGSGDEWHAVEHIIAIAPFVEDEPIEEDVGLVTETNIAQPIGKSKKKIIGQAGGGQAIVLDEPGPRGGVDLTPTGTTFNVSAGSSWATALSSAGDGDTIILGAGTHSMQTITKSMGVGENVNIFADENATPGTVIVRGLDLSSASGLTFRGIKFDTVDTWCVWHQDGARIKIQGCTFDLASSSGDVIAVDIRQNSDQFLIEDCTFEDGYLHVNFNSSTNANWPTNTTIRYNEFKRVIRDHIFISRSSGVTIEKNVIHDLVDSAEHSDGVQTVGSENLIIKANHFYCDRTDRDSFTDRNDHAIMINDDPGTSRANSNVIIENNLIHDWIGTGISVAGCDGLIVTNNTVYDCGDNGAAEAIVLDADSGNLVVGVELRNNIFNATSTPDATIDVNTNNFVADGSGTSGSNELTGDPGFVDSINFDYSLLSNSQNRDSGTNTGAPIIDINGVTRDTTIDRGALEFFIPAGEIALPITVTLTPSGIEEPVNQISSTNIAQPIGKLKTKSINQSSSSNAAQSIGRRKTVTLAQVEETDEAQPIDFTKQKAISQVEESSTAQTINRIKNKTLGQPFDTEEAQLIEVHKAKEIGQTEETSLAQSVDSSKVKSINLTDETDTAQGISAVRSYLIGQASETDSALSLEALLPKSIDIGIAEENNLVQPVTIFKERNITQASEVNSNQPISITKAKEIGQTEESDSALPLVKQIVVEIAIENNSALSFDSAKSKEISQSSSIELAQPISSKKFKALGFAEEIDSSNSITSKKFVVIGQALETNISFTSSWTKQKGLALAQEFESALPIGSNVLIPIDRADETNSALSITSIKTNTLDQSEETDSALSVKPFRFIPLNLSEEIDSAQSVKVVKSITLDIAEEISSANSISFTKIKEIGLAQEEDQALILEIANIRLINTAIETDEALSVGWLPVRMVHTAIETDIALPITVQDTLGVVEETNTALPVLSRKDLHIGLVEETDSLLSIKGVKSQTILVAEEIDESFGVGSEKKVEVKISSEEDTTFSISSLKDKTLSIVLENNLAQSIESKKFKEIGLSEEQDQAINILPVGMGPLGLPSEIDLAQPITWTKTKTIGIAIDVERAASIIRGPFSYPPHYRPPVKAVIVEATPRFDRPSPEQGQTIEPVDPSVTRSKRLM